MKINVIYDSQGKVISVHEFAPTSDAGTPQFGAVLEKGHRAAPIDVPARLQSANFAEIAQRVRVDVTRSPHTLTLR